MRRGRPSRVGWFEEEFFWVREKSPVAKHPQPSVSAATNFGVRMRWWSGGLAEDALERAIHSTPNTTDLRQELGVLLK